MGLCFYVILVLFYFLYIVILKEFVCVYNVIVLFLIIKVYNFEVIYFVYKIVKYDRWKIDVILIYCSIKKWFWCVYNKVIYVKEIILFLML